MKSKVAKIILIVLLIIIVLIVINLIRNYSIIKEISNSNEKFEENIGKMKNFYLLKETKSSSKDGYMNVKTEVYYKDAIYLEKVEGNVNDEKNTTITWYDYNNKNGIRISNNTEEEISVNDIPKISNLLDIYKISNENIINVLFSKYLFVPISIKENSYVFNDSGTITYINKDNKLIKKSIGKDIQKTQKFNEGIVQDTDVEKPNIENL